VGLLAHYRNKGGGRTGRVNPKSEKSHSSGAMTMREALKEAVPSNLLFFEAPFGSHRTLAIIGTGTIATANEEEFGARAIVTQEDPLRWGHFVLNDTAAELGGQYQAEDIARVKAALKNIVQALPKPRGLDVRGMSEQELFVVGQLEAIDRQAIQHGYLWAHRMFHGATSPSNAALDGRLLDFGTFTFLDGYQKAIALHDDGHSGDLEVFRRDLIEPTQATWRKYLPAHLLPFLLSEKDWYARLRKTFDETRRDEMVRLAGAMDTLFPQFKNYAQSRALGDALIKIAETGNDRIISVWGNDGALYGTGTYDMAKLFVVLAQGDLFNAEKMDASLRVIIADDPLRADLLQKYRAAFLLQRNLALAAGITSEAEHNFRLAAAEFRNKPRTSLFRSDAYEELLTQGLANPQKYIDDQIRASRREFRDAEPFTLVTGERETNGRRVRTIFDARTNKFERLVVKGSCEVLLEAAY
jgi:hypothetical protein